MPHVRLPTKARSVSISKKHFFLDFILVEASLGSISFRLFRQIYIYILVCVTIYRITTN